MQRKASLLINHLILYIFVLGESKRLHCVIDTMYEHGEYAIPA